MQHQHMHHHHFMQQQYRQQDQRASSCGAQNEARARSKSSSTRSLLDLQPIETTEAFQLSVELYGFKRSLRCSTAVEGVARKAVQPLLLLFGEQPLKCRQLLLCQAYLAAPCCLLLLLGLLLLLLLRCLVNKDRVKRELRLLSRRGEAEG